MKYIKIGLRLMPNVIWKITGGVVFALIWIILGTILSISIIGLPLGIKCFKIAHFVWKPFGKEVAISLGDNVIVASIWCVTFGVVALILGLIWIMSLTISIVGIPLVYQMYKVIKVSIFPFGARIV